MKVTVASRKGKGSQLLLCPTREEPPLPAPVVVILFPLGPALAAAAAEFAPAPPVADPDEPVPLVEVAFVVAVVAAPLAATPAVLPPPPLATFVADPFAADDTTPGEIVAACASRRANAPSITASVNADALLGL